MASLRSFIGAYDGSRGSLFYAGEPHGWVVHSRFVELYEMTPAEFCRVTNERLLERAGERIVYIRGAFPDPHPGRETFLGFVPPANSRDPNFYAIYVNDGAGGELVDATMDHPTGRGRYHRLMRHVKVVPVDECIPPPMGCLLARSQRIEMLVSSADTSS